MHLSWNEVASQSDRGIRHCRMVLQWIRANERGEGNRENVMPSTEVMASIPEKHARGEYRLVPHDEMGKRH